MPAKAMPACRHSATYLSTATPASPCSGGSAPLARIAEVVWSDKEFGPTSREGGGADCTPLRACCVDAPTSTACAACAIGPTSEFIRTPRGGVRCASRGSGDGFRGRRTSAVDSTAGRKRLWNGLPEVEAGESGGDGDGGRHPHPIMDVGMCGHQVDRSKVFGSKECALCGVLNALPVGDTPWTRGGGGRLRTPENLKGMHAYI